MRALRLLALPLMLATHSAAAEPLKAPALTQALTGARLSYDDGTEQSFAPDGRTLFFARDGSESIGHWEIRGDQYCSVWPPSDHWACYDVTEEGGTIAFIAGDGSTTTGRRKP